MFKNILAGSYRIQTWEFLFKRPTLILEFLLSHEDLTVRPFSKEVFWSLSFPGGPFGFVIDWPVKGGNK